MIVSKSSKITSIGSAVSGGLVSSFRATSPGLPGARTGLASVDALGGAHGVTSIERPYLPLRSAAKAAATGHDRWFMFRFATTDDMAEVADAYRADPNVAAVSLDWRAYPDAVPNDPLHPDHWGHDNTSQMISYDWSTHTHTGPTVGTVGFDANAQGARLLWLMRHGAPIDVVLLETKARLADPQLSEAAARRAAQLRSLARTGSAVDALVVALAEPGGTVLTGDRADLEALAAHADRVAIEVI